MNEEGAQHAASDRRCLQDVSAALLALPSQGSDAGFHLAPGTSERSDPTPSKHWQGVQRLRDTAAGPVRLVVSRDQMPCETPRGECGGFVVAELSSLSASASPPGNPSAVPTSGDRVVLERAIPDPRFDHAGGIQVAGHLLALGLERGAELSQVLVFDMSDPLKPRELARTEERPGQGAGAIALELLDTGKVLLFVGGWDSDRIDIYRSTTAIAETKQDTRFVLEDSWTKQELGADKDALAYQNINLLAQCDGARFLLALGRRERTHRADLYRAELAHEQDTANWQFSQKLTRSFSCGARGSDEVHCNFAAAAGAYITEDQTLLLYATEHENTGGLRPGTDTTASARGYVKLREFAPE